MNQTYGFSLVESLIVMLLASLIMILTVDLQLVFLKQWRHQEILIDWQENQRLGYVLLKAWLKRLAAEYEDNFILTVLLPEDARLVLEEPWKKIFQYTKPGVPILVAYSEEEVDSVWYISNSSGLFYKEKETLANELLAGVDSWKVSIQKPTSSYATEYLLDVSMQWKMPLQRWGSVPFYYVYTQDTPMPEAHLEKSCEMSTEIQMGRGYVFSEK